MPTITHRAFQALLILVGSLSIESLLLVPGQSTWFQGIEIVAVAVTLWAALNWLEWASWWGASPTHRSTLRAHSVEILR
ncbi:MAG: hypothetical protein WA691_10045 [Thermoplasmata archaeon]